MIETIGKIYMSGVTIQPDLHTKEEMVELLKEVCDKFESLKKQLIVDTLVEVEHHILWADNIPNTYDTYRTKLMYKSKYDVGITSSNEFRDWHLKENKKMLVEGVLTIREEKLQKLEIVDAN